MPAAAIAEICNMATPSIFYRLLQPLLKARGMEIVPIRRHEKRGFFDSALTRELARGSQPGTVIDVGASDGRWSVETSAIFPRARYHMIEPLSERTAALESICQQHLNFSFVSAAAANHPGEAQFIVSEDLDGSALSFNKTTGGSRTVQVTTIDLEVKRLNLPAPYIIKLDTHGFEKAIIEGATATLASANLLIIEAYNYPIQPGAWRFHELTTALEIRGFRCSDLVNLVWRPRDEMFWHCDMFFKPATSPEFRSNSYQ